MKHAYTIYFRSSSLPQASWYHRFLHSIYARRSHQSWCTLCPWRPFWFLDWDDDPTTFAEQIKSEFRQLTQQGVPCYFTKGNRDFLVGKRFAQQTGVQLLPDEAVIDLYGQKASYCMEIHSAPKIHATLNFEPKYISLGYSDYLDFFLLHLSKSLSAKYSQTYEMTNNISPWWSWMLHPAKSSRLCIDIT